MPEMEDNEHPKTVIAPVDDDDDADWFDDDFDDYQDDDDDYDW